jgi:hypothetical protein
MKNLMVFALFVALAVAGCKKNDNPADSSQLIFAATGTFSTGNVKVSPAYFSFDTKDTTAPAHTWDILLTNTLMSVDPSIPPIKYPVIQFNRSSGVSGTIVDGKEFETIDPSAVTGLKTDTNDTTLVIGTNCLNYDGATHRLSPFPNRSFVVRTASNKLVKFRVVSYYNTDGVSGFMTFDYAIK